MKHFALVIALALFGAPTAAQDSYDGYIALLGPEDLTNSSGVRLRSAAAIVQQDRANFHRFGIRHSWDQSDPFFASQSARASMGPLIRMSPHTEEIIVRQGALVYVQVQSRGNRIVGISVEIPG